MAGRYLTPDERIEFNQDVWATVREIPPGRVATYGQIASYVLPPQGVAPGAYRALGPRWVGAAMKSCPDDVPWQRVINAQGKISVQGDTARLQRQLLQQEGVRFDRKDRVDLSIYQWKKNADTQSQLELPI